MAEAPNERPMKVPNGDESGAPAGLALTDDKLLDGQLRLLQPARGHRVGQDAVLLAAAVPAHPGELALEGGAGIGAASLCLAHRVPGLSIDAIDIDPTLADLCRQNAERNGLADAVEAYCGDIMDPPYRITANTYHHVFMNPPFLEQHAAIASPQPQRASAHRESGATLRDWVKFATSMARPGGTITIIHRVDRLDDLFATLKGRAGSCEIFPLWPGSGMAAKHVIVRAYKGQDGGVKLLSGLTLHAADTKYTEAAERVLRGGEALKF